MFYLQIPRKDLLSYLTLEFIAITFFESDWGHREQCVLYILFIIRVKAPKSDNFRSPMFGCLMYIYT